MANSNSDSISGVVFMNEKIMDINQLIPQIMDALRNLGVTERSIWRNHHDLYLSISKFYRSHGVNQYSVELMADYTCINEKKFKDGEITQNR
ncbi:hypothetical protein [Petroclostridium sp. X23]|uniref:hypothetical protein n=1 Tax=Petroclostridium sp. X23 TaxID=3045146 RepID=UPI0024AD403C|nr:hypothetical protein [Petroclostridium sp. X23]WHH60062.1 hypothetical protein QKW49_04775 [Petroclostridium sp. X23]